MEFIREDCIYARQSVDRKDSISIESQIDFCKYELKGGSCRVFKDKGYSGKNTDRPEFQKLLGEIRKGKVRRVIVYMIRIIVCFSRSLAACELLHMVGAETLNPYECRETMRKSQGGAAYRTVRLSPYNRLLKNFV